MHFQCSDWFIQLRLTGHIPSQLKWECIAPIVAELKKAANVQDLMKFDKTINLFALVGYETSYSQRVGYLPSHIQRAHIKINAITIWEGSPEVNLSVLIGSKLVGVLPSTL